MTAYCTSEYIIPIYEVLHHVCEIGALSCIQEVAEAGNITAAAQALYISQSAVSQSIKQLEGELQTRLFARNSRGVALTPDGRMLYEYVRSAIGLLETGEEKLSQSRELQMGHLDHRRQRHRHQPVPAAVSGSVPPAVSRHPHPDRFRPQPQGTGPAAIRQGGYRLCQHPPGVRLAGDAPLLRHPPCSWRRRTIPATSAMSILWRRSPPSPLILLERKASSRLYLEKYFLQNGQRLHPEIELGARSLLVDLAAIGFGVAGVTEEFVHEELSKGRLRKLATDFEIPPRSVDLCVLRTCL